MTLEQFLSYGLIPGCKYRVRLKTGGGKHKDFILFFKGFRLFAGSQSVQHSHEVVPVFCEPTANGKMSRKHFVQYSTQVHDIVAIMSTEESEYAVINEYVASSMEFAYSNFKIRAAQQVRHIIDEMNLLFPGQVIPINPENTVAVEYGDTHESYPALGFCMDGDGRACAVIEDETGAYVKMPLCFCETGSPLRLLQVLIRSIENPYKTFKEKPHFNSIVKYTVDRHGEWKCGTDHDKLPVTNEGTMPVLSELETIEVLRANLWFAALPYPRQETVLKDYFGVTAPTPASHTYVNWLHAPQQMRLMCYHYYKNFPDAWKSHKH